MSYILAYPIIRHIMIIKCIDCNEPMTPTNKGKPKDLPPNVDWVSCRQCEKSIEIVKSDVDPDEDAEPAKALEYEETVITYVVIKKSSKGVTKKIYADKEHKNLIREETLG